MVSESGVIAMCIVGYDAACVVLTSCWVDHTAGKRACSTACQEITASLATLQLTHGEISLIGLSPLGLHDKYYFTFVIGRHTTA